MKINIQHYKYNKHFFSEDLNDSICSLLATFIKFKAENPAGGKISFVF